MGTLNQCCQLQHIAYWLTRNAEEPIIDRYIPIESIRFEPRVCINIKIDNRPYTFTPSILDLSSFCRITLSYTASWMSNEPTSSHTSVHFSDDAAVSEKRFFCVLGRNTVFFWRDTSNDDSVGWRSIQWKRSRLQMRPNFGMCVSYYSLCLVLFPEIIALVPQRCRKVTFVSWDGRPDTLVKIKVEGFTAEHTLAFCRSLSQRILRLIVLKADFQDGSDFISTRRNALLCFFRWKLIES